MFVCFFIHIIFHDFLATAKIGATLISLSTSTNHRIELYYFEALKAENRKKLVDKMSI